MSEKEFNIIISELEKANTVSNSQWLDTTFTKARQVIEAGGIVNITEQFSDTHLETVSVIDNLEGLNHYIKKFSL